MKNGIQAKDEKTRALLTKIENEAAATEIKVSATLSAEFNPLHVDLIRAGLKRDDVEMDKPNPDQPRRIRIIMGSMGSVPETFIKEGSRANDKIVIDVIRGNQEPNKRIRIGVRELVDDELKPSYLLFEKQNQRRYLADLQKGCYVVTVNEARSHFTVTHYCGKWDDRNYMRIVKTEVGEASLEIFEISSADLERHERLLLIFEPAVKGAT